MIDVERLYQRFLELGGPPPGDPHPWRYRRACTSMRLEGCLFLAELVRRRRPARVLDLGSGMTSHLFRALMAELPAMEVWTTDTSAGWLKQTKEELLRDGLNANRMILHGAFHPGAGETWDLISVDAGDMPFRVGLLPELVAWCAPRGILVFDDWAMEPLAERATPLLEACGFRVLVQLQTADLFGQFLATAERA